MKNEDLVKLFLTEDLPNRMTKTNCVDTLVVTKQNDTMFISSYGILIGYKTPQAVHVVNASNTPFYQTTKKHIALLLSKARELVAEKLILTPIQRGETQVPNTDLLVQRFEAQMEHLAKGTDLIPNKEKFIEVYNSYKKFLNVHGTTSKFVEKYNNIRVNISDDKYMSDLEQQRLDYQRNSYDLEREGVQILASV